MLVARVHAIPIDLVLLHSVHFILQGHPVASSLSISACSPSSPVLEKPSQTAVAKGGCVCENTHLSPADGSFSGHTVPPARLPSRAWPPPQSAQQATGITPLTRSFLWIKGPQHIFKYRSMPCFPWPLQSILCSTNTPLCDISAATTQRYSALVVLSFLLLLKHE